MRSDAALEFRLRGPWQRSLRHEKEPIDWRKFALGLGIAVLLTALELIGFNRGMRRHSIDSDYRGSIQVSLIDATPLVAIIEPPLPEPAALQRRPSRIRIDTPKAPDIAPPVVKVESSSREMNARIGDAATSARLFDANGRIRLPDTVGKAVAPVAATREERARENWKEMRERGQNPLDCHRTRFAQAFRKDQSVGDAVAGKYLKYIGLANQASIARNLGQREERAADGCDPPR